MRGWLSSLKQVSHFINSLTRLTLLKITPPYMNAHTRLYSYDSGTGSVYLKQLSSYAKRGQSASLTLLKIAPSYMNAHTRLYSFTR